MYRVVVPSARRRFWPRAFLFGAGWPDVLDDALLA